METPETIPQAEPADNLAPVEASPWASAMAAPALRLQRPVETVHWSIVALTALTAVSVLFGAYGRTASAPRELLPVMIVAPAR